MLLRATLPDPAVDWSRSGTAWPCLLICSDTQAGLAIEACFDGRLDETRAPSVAWPRCTSSGRDALGDEVRRG